MVNSSPGPADRVGEAQAQVHAQTPLQARSQARSQERSQEQSQDQSRAQAQAQALSRRCAQAEARVLTLAAANEDLHRELDCEARRLQSILRELGAAAERLGQPRLAQAIHEVAAAPWDTSAALACGRPVSAACACHGAQRCASCHGLPHLSAREREVLRLLTEGQRSSRIAAHLGICDATVEVHRRNIMRKLGLHTVAALTKYALREGLTSL